MADEMTDVRSDIAQTRVQLSDTLAEIERRVASMVGEVEQKLDVARMIRANPWPALAIAFGAGVALSASGAGRKAASATVRAGKRAPNATVRVAKRASSKATAVARHALSRGDEAHRGGEHDAAGRWTHGIGRAVQARVAVLVDELRHAAEDINPGTPGPPAAPARRLPSPPAAAP